MSYSKLENIFTNIYNNTLWHMGQNESKSGLGSTDDYTKNIRKKIVEVVNTYNIKNMIDTSCGDLYWMKTIIPLLNCDYLGLDIVKDIIENNNKLYKNLNNKMMVDFKYYDFLSYLQLLPNKSVDLILCRHTCEHLPTEYIIKFINEAKRVSKYLLLTTHRNATSNIEIIDSETPYRPINLNLLPYSNLLNKYQVDSFYDGPESCYLSEMYINFYSFISDQKIDMTTDITAIINIYKRPHTVDTQLEAIRSQTIPPKCIFIWNNGNKNIDLTKYKVMPDVRVFDNNFNYGVWSRFLIGFLAPTKYICIFDDDTVPGNRWFENCIESMENKEALYGTIGVIFKEFDRYVHLKRYGWDGSCNSSVAVDIVGHSWFFKKEWLKYFVREEPQVYTKISNGEDIHFSFMLQKYANIPTLVPPHPLNDTSLWGSQPKTAWEWGCDGNSETGSNYPIDKMYTEYINRGFSILIQRQNTTSKLDLDIFKNKIINRIPFAIIRPSGGEYHILQNKTITNCDNWTFESGGKLYNDLKGAIELAVKTSCYIGIPSESDNKSVAEWYYKTFNLHPYYTTFANIFVNANWNNFIEFLNNQKIVFTYIGPSNNPSSFFIENFIQIPEFLVNDWDTKCNEYMDKIQSIIVKSVNKIFLFACGPLSKIFIAQAWAKHPYNIYLDIGSSLDLFLKGSTNRYYTTGDQTYSYFTPSLITL